MRDLEWSIEAIYMQQRACLRAAPGDWIATTHPVDPDFIEYLEQRLQIQPLRWVVAQSANGPTKLAISCIRCRVFWGSTPMVTGR